MLHIPTTKILASDRGDIRSPGLPSGKKKNKNKNKNIIILIVIIIIIIDWALSTKGNQRNPLTLTRSTLVRE